MKVCVCHVNSAWRPLAYIFERFTMWEKTLAGTDGRRVSRSHLSKNKPRQQEALLLLGSSTVRGDEIGVWTDILTITLSPNQILNWTRTVNSKARAHCPNKHQPLTLECWPTTIQISPPKTFNRQQPTTTNAYGPMLVIVGAGCVEAPETEPKPYLWPSFDRYVEALNISNDLEKISLQCLVLQASLPSPVKGGSAPTEETQLTCMDPPPPTMVLLW